MQLRADLAETRSHNEALKAQVETLQAENARLQEVVQGTEQLTEEIGVDLGGKQRA